MQLSNKEADLLTHLIDEFVTGNMSYDEKGKVIPDDIFSQVEIDLIHRFIPNL